MGFSLNMDTDNAAFADDRAAEVARILRQVTRKIAAGNTAGILKDINGNRVGAFILADWVQETRQT